MTQDTQNIHDIVEQRLSIADFPDAERAEIVDRTVDVLSKRIFVDLLPALSEEDRFVLSDMLADGELSDDEIDAFLRGVVTKYQETVQQTVAAFFEEMDQVVAKSQKQS